MRAECAGVLGVKCTGLRCLKKNLQWDTCFTVQHARLLVLEVAIGPSLDFQLIIWMSAWRANVDNSGPQDRCTLVLNLTGTPAVIANTN